MLSARSKDGPDDQFVFCSGLASSTLKTSTNPAMRRCLARRKPFSTRTSRSVMLSMHAAGADSTGPLISGIGLGCLASLLLAAPQLLGRFEDPLVGHRTAPRGS